jgi:DNA-binding Lrp family transcriptional regulator
MVTAVILINTARKRVNEVAEALAGVKGISEVYSVAGRYDLIAILRVKTNEDMANLVTREIVAIDGIEHTETILAFKAYSRHDLAAMFSIGF